MNVLILMIPLGLAFAALFVWGFFWATNNDQFRDLDTPPHRMLFNENTKIKSNSKTEMKTTE